MKKALYTTLLAAAIAVGAATAPVLAGDARSERAMTSHIKKIRQNASATKRTPAESDLYTTARELQMKISM